MDKIKSSLRNLDLPVPFPTRWLVTGGCGFIGTSFIKQILTNNQNVKILVLDNLSVGSREDLAGVCSYTEVSSSELAEVNNVGLIVGDIRKLNLEILKLTKFLTSLT